MYFGSKEENNPVCIKSDLFYDLFDQIAKIIDTMVSKAHTTNNN